MPSRPNPYYGSPDIYSSRSLAPGGRISGGESLALPLANLASTIAEVATYDPATDPRVIGARADKLKIDQARDASVAAGQERQMFNDPTIPLGDIASHALAYGHAKPEDAGKLALLAAAARGPAEGQNMDDALSSMGLYELAAGTPGGSTFNASTYGNRMKPTNVMENGAPKIVAAQDSYGSTPVLSEADRKGIMLGDLAASLTPIEQKQVVGANPPQRTPYNYIGPDGQGSTTDPSSVAGPGVTIYSGGVQAATPDGLTNGNKTNVQAAQLALKNFQDLVGMARGIAAKDPTLFGVTGEARRGVQEINQQLGNLRLMTGSKASDLDGIYQDTLAKMAANGIQVPGAAYDPNLSDIRKLSVLMRYAGAAALAGQQGRSVSNEDVKTFAGVVGDPGSWLSSQQSYLSGLDLMDKIAGQMSERNAAALGKAGAAAPAAAPAAPAAAPAGGPAVGTVEDGYRFNGGDPADKANWVKVQ